MAIKDLGPDIINLVPDPDNNEPWKDDVRPSFPKLDDELDITKVHGDFVVNMDVLLSIGNT